MMTTHNTNKTFLSRNPKQSTLLITTAVKNDTITQHHHHHSFQSLFSLYTLMEDTQDFDMNYVDDNARLKTGCFSELLFSDQISSSKMLCFGRSSVFSGGGGVTCSDSSSTSDLVSPPSTINGSHDQTDIVPDVTDRPARRVKCKKSSNKIQKPQAKTGHAKQVRNKVKLGERIIALQQLVSPFGKTDTASVLHETRGYIKFLHDQVTILCSPYLQSLDSHSSSTIQQHGEGGENKDAEKKGNLRSTGLCLVPVEFTVHFANNNGADFWSPTMTYESIKAPKENH